MTAEQFAEYLDLYPPTLPAWRRPGKGGVPTAVAGLNYSAALRTAETPLEVSDKQNGLAIATDWAMRYMNRRPGKKIGGLYAEELWRTAIVYWQLSNYLEEVDHGLRGFESRGSRICLPYIGDFALHGLGCWLKVADDLRPTSQEATFYRRVAEAAAPLRLWFEAGGGRVSWFRAPVEIRGLLRAASDALMAGAPTYLPPGAVTPGGHTLGMIRSYWSELLSLAMYNNFAMKLEIRERATLAPEFPRQAFVKQMAMSAEVPVTAADEATTLLTLDTDRLPDIALTPLVRLDNDSIFVMTSLVIPANPERNILKVLQHDRRGFGTMGNLLGSEGEQKVSQLLRERMGDGILCETNIRAILKKGRDASDLDVVVYSPRENLLVVLEVKWHIAVDGAYESRTTEESVLAKQARLKKLSRAVQSNATKVVWPDMWPDVPDTTEWRWFVLTNDFLPTQPTSRTDITIRSFQMLKHLLTHGASARTLVDLLDQPPTPAGCTSQWEKLHFGELRVYVERVDFPRHQPSPFTLRELEALPPSRRSTTRKRLKRQPRGFRSRL